MNVKIDISWNMHITLLRKSHELTIFVDSSNFREKFAWSRGICAYQYNCNASVIPIESWAKMIIEFPQRFKKRHPQIQSSICKLNFQEWRKIFWESDISAICIDTFSKAWFLTDFLTTKLEGEIWIRKDSVPISKPPLALVRLFFMRH